MRKLTGNVLVAIGSLFFILMITSTMSGIVYLLGIPLRGLPVSGYEIGRLIGAVVAPFVMFFVGRAVFDAGQSRLDAIARAELELAQVADGVANRDTR